MQKSNLLWYAEREFATLKQQNAECAGDELIIVPFETEILSLIEKVGKSGQSGGSIGFTVGEITRTLKKLLMFQPLSPIQGTEDEWTLVASDGGRDLYQNNRCSALFKYGDDNIPYYLDAISWKLPDGETVNGSIGALDSTRKMIACRQNVTFPFIPKTFYIDVTEADDKRFIKDDEQLQKALNYYSQ